MGMIGPEHTGEEDDPDVDLGRTKEIHTWE